MEEIIEKFLNSVNNNVTFDMKVKAIQDLDANIFNSTYLKNMQLFERIIEVTAKYLKSTQYKTTYEILIFLSHMNQYLSQKDNMAIYFRIYIPYLYGIALERLGDSKEKIRELTAVYILEVMQLASYFPREKFNLVIEKEFRTAIATTKFFRVKEQLIMLVTESYKTIQSFKQQIQYYIPNIVQSLEDSNEVVRSSSKESIIDIIRYSQNHPEVIRQIKRELVKNKVRQAIIDSIFSQVTVLEDDSKMDSPVSKTRLINSNPQSNTSSPQLSTTASSSSFENIKGLGIKTPPPNYPPPPPPHQKVSSSSSVPATSNNSASSSPINVTVFKFPGKRTVSQDISPIVINSEKEFETNLRNMLPTFMEKESENNWEKRERFMKQIRGMIRGGAAEYDGNCRYIKIMLEHILKTTHSLRTTLAITTIGTIIEIAENYQSQMDPIAEAVVTNLLDLTSQTKKLIASSATQAIYIILRNISYNQKILNLIANGLSDKNANTRSSACLALGVMFEEMAKSENSKSFLVRSGGLDIIEKCIKKGLQDANPSVRETTRTIYSVLNEHWNDRSNALMNTLDITTRKALMRTLNTHSGTNTATSSPKLVRRSKIPNSPALGEPLQAKRQDSRPSTPAFSRGKSQSTLNSPKLTSTSSLLSESQQHARPLSMSPQRYQTSPNVNRKSSTGLGSNSSSPRSSMSPLSSFSSVNSHSMKSGIKIENSSLLQSMNKALNSNNNGSIDIIKPKPLYSSPKISNNNINKDNYQNISSSSSIISSSQPSMSPIQKQEQLKREQLKQQKLQELQQMQQMKQMQRPRQPSSSGSTPNSEKSESEILSPICIQILEKLKDKEWKNRVEGLEDLLSYITSPSYEQSEKLTKTYLSLFRDPSPYILNTIFKPEMLQAVVESRFVSLDKLIPKIYSVIEPPDEKTGEFDDLSKTAYDAIVWLKKKIRKEVILDSLFICLENKLNNQFMSETVFEGVLSWLVEIIDRTPRIRSDIERYFNQNNNYNVALEELLELLVRSEDNNSINNVYIIKLIESLQELNPTSYDDVMSEYAENIQFIILKRIHNNDYDLSDIEREFIEKELSQKPTNKFRESHLFDSSFSLDDPKSNLLTEETVPEGFSDLTISRNTSIPIGIGNTEDNYSENLSIINELVSKTWNSQPEGNDTTIKDKSENSDTQSTPKLSYKKPDMEEDIIQISSPIEVTNIDTIDEVTNKEDSTILDNYGETIEDDRIHSLNKQFKILIDIIQESNEIDHDILDIKVFRRLIRYSREYPLKKDMTKIQGKSNIAQNLWGHWFKQLYYHLYQYVDNESNVKNIENYENCILLIKHLIINQTSNFDNYEKDTMQILIKCRSLNIDEVCSASEDTIEALCEELNSEKSIEACIELFGDEDFIAESPLSSEFEEYRPSYMGTLYMILSKIIQYVNIHYINMHLNSLMNVITKGMNHSEVEIRKAALDSLVAIYFVYNENNKDKTETGEQFLNTISKYLNLPQKRILEIYIQKFQY
ncbi:ARM repeat-containing protein [Piromyces finnis]|uniref:ARM repeat-containing protein n=1 Tax=Piromyces finnis TaxID=1754191 RepID=A0A1Y1V730_9FUNG|nr:ARM repeat-containing protein [Piromyces finnis]|eukprot:ORX48925.1 ARM repeat-containing protein [Piromyces finnis]